MVVTGIALLFTAGWIVMQRPEPFYALITGTGFGALGAGIIAIALKWVRRMDALVGLSDEEVPPPRARPDGPDLDGLPPPRSAHAMTALLRWLVTIYIEEGCYQ